jgi:L-asparaginase II
VAAHPLGARDGVVLAELVRDSEVESLHHGVLAVVDSLGNLLLERGDSTAIVYPRSTLKPLQALAVLATGVEVTGLELALTTASHCGSQEHRRGVEAFLAHHGLTPSHLQCPSDWPLAAAERAHMARDEGEPNRLAMNCSGKHAGFLAACQHSGWDLETYLHPSHPLQRSIVETITHYAQETPAFSSTDGCGSPLHAVSVRGLATALATVAGAKQPAEKQLLSAVSSHAWALDGHGRDNTVTIDTLGGIAKIGAEGLVVIATPEGVAVAVKILDGSMRATTPVALAALAEVGAISRDDQDELSRRFALEVKGGDHTIGALRTSL